MKGRCSCLAFYSSINVRSLKNGKHSEAETKTGDHSKHLWMLFHIIKITLTCQQAKERKLTCTGGPLLALIQLIDCLKKTTMASAMPLVWVWPFLKMIENNYYNSKSAIPDKWKKKKKLQITNIKTKNNTIYCRNQFRNFGEDSQDGRRKQESCRYPKNFLV